jgi:uncharacterized protein DUF5808
MKRLNTVLSVLVFASFAAAVVEQMRRPADQRTWRGRAFDVIPYDFTVPTMDRLVQAYWNPNSSTILTDRPLGIGWAVNFAALYGWLRSQIQAAR